MAMDVEEVKDCQEDFLLKEGIITVKNRRKHFRRFWSHTKIISCVVIPTLLFLFGLVIVLFVRQTRHDTNLTPSVFPFLTTGTPTPDTYDSLRSNSTNERSDFKVPTSVPGFDEIGLLSPSELPTTTVKTQLKDSPQFDESSNTTPSHVKTEEITQNDRTQHSPAKVSAKVTSDNAESEDSPEFETSAESEDSSASEVSTEVEDSPELKSLALDGHAPITPSIIPSIQLTHGEQKLTTKIEKIEPKLSTESMEFVDQDFTPNTTPSPETEIPQSDQRSIFPEETTSRTTVFDVSPGSQELGDEKGLPNTTSSPGTEYPLSDHRSSSAEETATSRRLERVEVFDVVPGSDELTDESDLPNTTPMPSLGLTTELPLKNNTPASKENANATKNGTNSAPTTSKSFRLTTTELPHLKTTKSPINQKKTQFMIDDGIAEYFHPTRHPKQNQTKTKYKKVNTKEMATPVTATPATDKDGISIFDVPDEDEDEVD